MNRDFNILYTDSMGVLCRKTIISNWFNIVNDFMSQTGSPSPDLIISIKVTPLSM